MEYSERMNELMDQLNKSIKVVNKLDYYKNELLKILDVKEKQEDRLSKSIQEYFDGINKTLFGISIEKGRVGEIGEIRTWKDGKKYKKMPDGKWVRVYQQQNRSAEISIARLKGKVKNAKSVEELYKICMENNHRFETENGYLPILQELANEVDQRQEQINDKVTRVKPLFEPRINENGVVKELDKESKLSNWELKKELKKFYKNKLQGGYVKNLLTGQRIMLSRDGLDEWESKSKTREQILSIKCLDYLLRNGKFDHNSPEIKNNRRAKSYDYYTCDCFINNKKYTAIITIRNTDMGESKYYHHYLDDIKIKPSSTISDQPENQGNPVLLDGSNNLIASTDNSVNKNLANFVNKNIKNLIQQKKELNDKRNELTIKRRELLYTKVDGLIQMNTSLEAKEGRIKLNSEQKELDEQIENNLKEIKKQDKLLDAEMDKINISDLINIDYEKDSRIENCKTAGEVEYLLKSKDWFRKDAEFKLDNIRIDSAKTIFKTYEHFFNVFPVAKGLFGGTTVKDYPDRDFYARGGGGDLSIEVNKKYHKEQRFEDSDFDQTMYHEMFHCLENLILKLDKRTTKDKGFASYIRQKTKSKYKDRDTATELSFYAETNASEFCAEGFGYAMISENNKTSDFAKEVFKQTYKFINLYKGKKVIL